MTAASSSRARTFWCSAPGGSGAIRPRAPAPLGVCPAALWDPVSRTAAGAGGRGGRSGSVQKADLAQDRDGVRVDVLALHEAVLEGDHVEAIPGDRLAAGRGDDVAAAHLLRVGGRRRPLLDD